MRIAIDVSPLDQPRATGVEKSLLLLLESLQRLQEDDQYFLVAPSRPKLLPDIRDSRFQTIYMMSIPGPQFLWRERWVPAMALRHGVQIWHSPVQALPLLLDRPKVATVHELSWLETQGVQDEGFLHKRRMVTRMVAKSADRVVCVSERTQHNFCLLHPAAAEKTLVVHHGIEDRFAGSQPARKKLHKKYGLPEQSPYFLTLGRALKRKAYPDAVRAFRVFLDRTDAEHHLVLAGQQNRRLLDSFDHAQRLGLGERVHLPGYIAEEDLSALYAGAEAFLMPSESEGFGIPLLEAMAAGTPVVASNSAAIPEVVGDGALLADFKKPLEVAEALRTVLGEERPHWIERGRKRAAQFPSDGPARKLLNLWRQMTRA